MEQKKYICFIASPSDTQQEREICDKLFDEINKSLGDAFNFRVESKKWENDTYPSFGEDGQDVINKQIGDEYHIFIGIMWSKFGSPTKHADSGTEEEFNIAYKRFVNKEELEIMFYFNNAALKLDNIDVSQLKKVQDFKKKVSLLGGLYGSYEGVNDFEKKLREHLTLFFKKKHTLDPVAYQAGIKNNHKLLTPSISEDHLEYLDNMEATFAHNVVDRIGLNDIYVPPNIQQFIAKSKSNLSKTENLTSVMSIMN